MQMRKTMLGGSSSDKSSSKDNSNSSSSSMSLLKRSSSSSSAASDADRKGDKGSKDGSADVNSNDFPPVMAKFLATRGAARGRTTKSAVELQEQINQRSKKISGRWADLEKQWRALEKERKDSASTYGVVGGGGAIVELNVGGTDMDVLRTDLVRAEDSVLANMFSGRWEGRLPRDSRGRVFVDVSPTSFRKVVGFLVKLGIATPGKVLELPTLTPDEQPAFDHLVLVLGLWPHVYEGKAAATVTGPSLQKQAEDELVRAPPVEPSDAKRFGQAVAQSFAAEEIALEKAAVELEEARERFDKEVESITKFAGAPAGFGGQHNMGSANQDDIVELNIGGTMAATRRSTLCRAADSVLARMFDHSNESRAPPFVRDAKGRYFVQYNDYCFAKIIEVLRSKRWPWPPTNTQLKEFGVGSLETSGATTERFKTFIRDDEREDFGSLVSYFFPGCERFIMEAVGRVSDRFFFNRRTDRARRGGFDCWVSEVMAVVLRGAFIFFVVGRKDTQAEEHTIAAADALLQPLLSFLQVNTLHLSALRILPFIINFNASSLEGRDKRKVSLFSASFDETGNIASS